MLTQRGLSTRTPARRDQTALTARSVRKILTNAYYKGIVRFADLEHPGEHPSLTDPVTWATVQDMLRARANGTRSRVHDHYLKGTLRCHLCGRRLIVHRARSKSGRIYGYFICPGRRGTPDLCQQRAIQIPDAEQRLEALWASFPVCDGLRTQVSQIVTTHSRRGVEELSRRAQGLRSIHDEVPTKRSRLLTGYEEGAIPPDIYLEMTEQLNTEVSRALEELRVITATTTVLQSALQTLANEAEADPRERLPGRRRSPAPTTQPSCLRRRPNRARARPDRLRPRLKQNNTPRRCRGVLR